MQAAECGSPQRLTRNSEEVRFSKYLQDARELAFFAANEWKKLGTQLERERALFGMEEDHDRLFKMDATEGPRRMRKKLEVLQRQEDDNVPYLKAETVTEGSMPSTPLAEHGDPWGSGDGVLVDEPSADDPARPEIAEQEATGELCAIPVIRFPVAALMVSSS